MGSGDGVGVTVGVTSGEGVGVPDAVTVGKDVSDGVVAAVGSGSPASGHGWLANPSTTRSHMGYRHI